jgi:hypothetical protein
MVVVMRKKEDLLGTKRQKSKVLPKKEEDWRAQSKFSENNSFEIPSFIYSSPSCQCYMFNVLHRLPPPRFKHPQDVLY